MPSNCAFGYENYCYSGTLTAAASEAALGPTNLAGYICAPSTGGQSPPGAAPAAPWAVLPVTAPTPDILFRGFGLFRTNLTSNAVVTVRVYAPALALTLTLGGPQPRAGQVIGVATSDVTADYAEF